MNILLSAIKRLLHIEPTNNIGLSIREYFPESEGTKSASQELSFSDYQHPARIEHHQNQGPLVTLGLQDHDFIKKSLKASS